MSGRTKGKLVMKRTMGLFLCIMCLTFAADAQVTISYAVENQELIHFPPGGAFRSTWNHASDQIAYVGHDGDFSVWIVDPLDATTARKVPNTNVAVSFFGEVAFTPDDQYIIAATAAEPSKLLKIRISDGQVTDYMTASDLGLGAGYGVGSPSVTIGTDGTNWLTFLTINHNVAEVVNEGIYRCAISADGSYNAASCEKIVGDFAFFRSPVLSHNGDMIMLERPLTPTTRRVVLYSGVNSLSEPISSEDTFTTISQPEYFSMSPNFSKDDTLLYYCMDVNQAFDEFQLIQTIPLSDFEVVVFRTSDAIAGLWNYYILTSAGNQALMAASSGGTRLSFIDTREGFSGLNVATLQVNALVTLGSNNEFLSDFSLTDGAGTLLQYEAGTVVNTMKKSGQKFTNGQVTISMSTPVSVSAEIQLPPGNILKRKFSEEYLTFTPAGSCTFTYTDSEVEGIDESTIEVVLISADGAEENAVVTARDLAENIITVEMPHFSILAASVALDTDGDGLTDDEEAILGTNPNLSDTDGDGISDYQEVNFDGNGAYNPFHPVNNPSGTDTDATISDTDGDGVSDGQEQNFGGNPLDSGSTPNLPIGSFTIFCLALCFVAIATGILAKRTVH